MANSTRKSALRAKSYRNFSGRNLVVAKAGPVTDLGLVKAAQVRVVAAKVAVMRPRVRTFVKPCSRNLIRTVTANSMKMNALPVKKCRNFSVRNLAAGKVVGLAVVKVAQVKAGQALVNPDRVDRVRAVDLVAEVKVDAAALVDGGCDDDRRSADKPLIKTRTAP